MKFKLDENLPLEAVTTFRAAGHDAHSVRDENLTGASDPSILQVCQLEGRILITLDLDFADIRHFPPAFYPGTIILRLALQDRDSIVSMMPRVLELLKRERIENRLWIMDETKTRIKGGD